jgi:hypothetical protein
MTELEIKWVEVLASLEDRFGKVPNMETMLFLIGMNEVGFSLEKQFKKEEKQDLMHVAMCILLEDDGYYEYTHHDADGWPHFNKLREFPAVGLKEQEDYLREKVIKYFGV